MDKDIEQLKRKKLELEGHIRELQGQVVYYSNRRTILESQCSQLETYIREKNLELKKQQQKIQQESNSLKSVQSRNMPQHSAFIDLS